MVVKKVKIYIKKINGICNDTQKRMRTSFLLFGIIPLYIKDEVLFGDYELR